MIGTRTLAVRVYDAAGRGLLRTHAHYCGYISRRLAAVPQPNDTGIDEWIKKSHSILLLFESGRYSEVAD